MWAVWSPTTRKGWDMEPAATERTFFDIHLHAMDLSHPNLMAFLQRQDSWLGLKMILGGLVEPLFKEKERKFVNLLSVMENSITDYFCLMEYYLLNKHADDDADSFKVNLDGTFRIGKQTLDTILLTPLIMDFGYKNIPLPTFYDKAPRKPVIEQSEDLFRAINKYCTSQLVQISGAPNRDGLNTVPRPAGNHRLLEIYPFMGINTQNYALTELQQILTRFFGGYTHQRSALYANMGQFQNTMKDVGSNFFAGIKLYPPLGFDPWPENAAELDKVVWMYGYCEERKIPVTVHCNDGGFAVDGGAQARTHPNKWKQVLEKHPNLRLNLAHMGKQGNALIFFPRSEWRETVIELVSTYENVYADISCLAFDDHFYMGLREILAKDQKLTEKILFGSDFMINLQWSPSYNDYIDRFSRSPRLTEAQRVKLCQSNAHDFLFG